MFNWFKKAEVKPSTETVQIDPTLAIINAVSDVVKQQVKEAIDKQFKDVDSVTYLQNQKLQLEKDVERLKKDLANLKEKNAEEESKKKIAELELQHLIKMKEEKMEVEFQKKEMTIKSETNDKIHATREEYSQKFIDQLKTQADKINEIYVQIMDRLPNVNMSIKQNTKA